MIKIIKATLLPLLFSVIPESGKSQTCPDFGDASNGIFQAVRDTQIQGGEYQFSNFIIEEGVRVRISGSKPLIIRCKEKAIIKGIVDASGENGPDALPGLTPPVGGVGVAGGGNGANAVMNPLQIVDGLQGQGWGPGFGGQQTSGGSGAGHAQAGSGQPNLQAGTAYGDASLKTLSAGSGGGSGSSFPGYASGAGGAGGGIIVIHALDSIFIGHNGALLSKGGNGGRAADNRSGSGAGGSGGTVWLATYNLSLLGSIDVRGGTGAIHTTGAPMFTDGGNGSEGRIRIEYRNKLVSGNIYPNAGHDKYMFIAGISRAVDISCYGKKNGFMRLRAMGGERPFQIQWSNGAVNEMISNLGPGIYSVTISDAAGCIIKDHAEIREPDPLSYRITALPPSCPSNADGQILLQADGGTPYPYSKSITTTLWSNTNSHGVMFDLDLKQKIQLNRIILNTDIVSIQRVGIWYKQGTFSGSEFDQSRWSFLGNYIVQGQGPGKETTVILPTPLPMQAIKYSFFIYNHDAPINCITSNALGSVLVFDPVITIYEGIGRDLSADGFSSAVLSTRNFAGRLAYEIRQKDNLSYDYMSPYGTGNRQVNLPSGEHIIKVKDALGCEYTDKITVPPSQSFKTEVTVKKEPTCHDAANGLIELKALTGTNKRALSTKVPNSAPSNGFLLSLDVKTPMELEAFNLFSSGTGPVSIYYRQGIYSGFEGDSSGWTFAGQYSGNNPSGNDLLTSFSVQPSISLSNGVWSFLIYTSAPFLLSLDSSEYINQQHLKLLSSHTIAANSGIFDTSSVSNHGFAGCIIYKLPPAQVGYTWNNGVHSNQIQNLKAGEYTALIGDTSGCFEKLNISLGSPPPIIVTSTMTKETDELSDGTLTVRPSGGTPPYYIQWVESGQTGPTLNGLPAGDYTVFVADKNGCRYTDTLSVSRFESPIKREGELILVPNPNKGQFRILKEIKGMNECQVIVTDMRGRLVSSSRHTQSILISEGMDLAPLKDGIYSISIFDDDQIFTGRVTIIH